MQAYEAQKVMDWRQCLVVVNIARDRVRLSAQPCGSDCGLSGQALGARRIAVAHAKDGIVPLDVHRWLGWPPTPTEQVAFHRTYLKLEASGLIHRVNLFGGRRTTHLKLTGLGERAAARLLAEDEAATREESAEAAAQSDDVAEDLQPFDLDSIDWSSVTIPDEPLDAPAEPGADTAPPTAAGSESALAGATVTVVNQPA